MLYFSKIKIILILIISLVISYFTLSNFVKFDDEIFKRKINLGLDLLGGSYLLLEVDNNPVITQKIQSKSLELKKLMKEEDIFFNNLVLINNEITFSTDDKSKESIVKLLDDVDSEINPYYPNFKSHEFDIFIENNNIVLKYSDYGLVLLKNSSLDQAI